MGELSNAPGRPPLARPGSLPRTCCPTHADRCRFGREHVWAGPFLLDGGRELDGHKWSHADDVHCTGCGGVCIGDRSGQDAASAPHYEPNAGGQKETP